MRRVAAFLALPCLAFAAEGAAQSVHKCRADDGSIAYQDEPCASGAELEAPVLDLTQLQVPPAQPVAREDDPPPAFVIERADPADTPPPPLFRCVRYDGQESVVTDQPVVKRYFVPAWAVVSEMESNQVGRANTKRQPAPNVLNAPPQVATGYVWVEDRCYELSLDEACEYWRVESNEADRLGRIAFDAERKELEAREVDFRARFETYCR